MAEIWPKKKKRGHTHESWQILFLGHWPENQEACRDILQFAHGKAKAKAVAKNVTRVYTLQKKKKKKKAIYPIRLYPMTDLSLPFMYRSLVTTTHPFQGIYVFSLCVCVILSFISFPSDHICLGVLGQSEGLLKIKNKKFIKTSGSMPQSFSYQGRSWWTCNIEHC